MLFGTNEAFILSQDNDNSSKAVVSILTQSTSAPASLHSSLLDVEVVGAEAVHRPLRTISARVVNARC